MSFPQLNPFFKHPETNYNIALIIDPIRYYQILLYPIRYYQILLDTIRSYQILLDIIRYYQILLDTIRYYQILLDPIRSYQILLDTIRSYQILLDTIRYYQILLDPIRYYQILLDTIRYYQITYKYITNGNGLIVNIINNILIYNTISNIIGHIISWTYFDLLHQYQGENGLHLVNKLTEQHINFKSQMMNVPYYIGLNVINNILIYIIFIKDHIFRLNWQLNYLVKVQLMSYMKDVIKL